MTKQELLAERDRLALQFSGVEEVKPDVYASDILTNLQRCRSTIPSYKAGFDAAVKIMQERENILREALEYAADQYSDGVYDLPYRAEEILTQVPEWKNE